MKKLSYLIMIQGRGKVDSGFRRVGYKAKAGLKKTGIEWQSLRSRFRPELEF